ncbi:MAG: hypothetical protein LBL63_05490 [Clostridiales Family XIII bacterium]|nr:hypothetical protein [Clostridiales Family XIII bacterium]
MRRLQEGVPQDDSPAMRFLCGVLRRRKAVILGFVLFTVLCTACIPLVNVNFDLTSYLPKEARSTTSMELMKDAYGT